MLGSGWTGAAAAGRGATTTGGLTTTVPGGGATTTTGRETTVAPTGALATTGPLGGRDAMAGEAGGATIGGAERGCGTTLRGSGRAGVAAAGGAAAAAGGAAALVAATAGAAGRAGAWLCLASASASCFLARMAFITSPGLETCERSIFGCIPCAPRAEDPPLPCPAALEPRSNCARTFSAS